jgi:hypothetical protein
MKTIPLKKYFRLLFCLGVLLALLAGGTMASAQRNRNGFGNNGNGGGNNDNGGGNNGNGFGNNGGGFGRNGGGFGRNGGGFRNNQLGNNVPGPTNYALFSGFISVRNIFNPARYAVRGNTVIRPTTTPRVGPAFSLVGTMSYEKGMFAFFDGNQNNLRKVLYQSDSNSIAGYTVAEITPAGVQLQSADKKQTVKMKIGEIMRQNGDAWQLSGQGDLSVGAVGGFGTGGGSAAPGVTGNTSVSGAGSTASPAPSPALEGNDILRKLMQQRQSELTK